MKSFGIVNSDVMRDPNLSLRAKGLYALLCTFADGRGICYPAISTLGELTGMTRRTIHRIINELELKNYVTRTGRNFQINR